MPLYESKRKLVKTQINLLEVLHFLPKTVQVEIIGDVFLVDFCEEFVSFQIAEPLNPAVAGLAVIFVVQVLVYIVCNCRVSLEQNRYFKT